MITNVFIMNRVSAFGVVVPEVGAVLQHKLILKTVNHRIEIDSDR